MTSGPTLCACTCASQAELDGGRPFTRALVRPAGLMPAPGVAVLPPDTIFVAETDDADEHAARVRLGERLLANLTKP